MGPQTTFEVTAPDGRVLEVTGDHTPTEAELRDIFATAGAAPSLTESITQGVKDLAGGVRAGVAKTVFRGGDVIRRATGMERVINRPEVQKGMTAPPTTMGKVGEFAEQAGEFMVPANLISKGVKGAQLAGRLVTRGLTPAKALLATGAAEGAAQGATSYGLTKLHGDEGAGMAAAISALAPMAGKAIEIGAPAIRAKAEQKLARLLATGIEDKGQSQLVDYALKTGQRAGTAVRTSVDNAVGIVRDAARELLDLPVMASWGKLQTVLGGRTESAKQLLGTALKGPLGAARVPVAPLVQAFDDMIQTTATHFAEVRGGSMQKVYDEPLYKALTELRDKIGEYGDPRDGLGQMITVSNLTDIKRVWDHVVYTLATAGKVNADPTTLISSAMKDAAFTGANAIRRVFADQAPTIAKLNEAVSHAIRLEDLVRKVAVAHPGMSEGASGIVHAIGIGAGGVSGQVGLGHWWLGSIIGAAGARAVTKAMESPLWHTLPSATRDRLAGAIQRGNADLARRIVAPILAAGAGQPAASAPPSGAPQ